MPEDIYEKMWEIDDMIAAIRTEVDLFSTEKEIEIQKLRIKRLGLEKKAIETRLAQMKQGGNDAIRGF